MFQWGSLQYVSGESVRLMTASPRILRRFDRLWWQLQQGQSLVVMVGFTCAKRSKLPKLGMVFTCFWGEGSGYVIERGKQESKNLK